MAFLTVTGQSAAVPKLSARAEGLISYKIGFVPDQSEVNFSLTGNEGGGYFSREWIPLTRVVAVLADLAGAQCRCAQDRLHRQERQGAPASRGGLAGGGKPNSRKRITAQHVRVGV